MNVNTGEVRDERNLTDAEKRSGQWVRVPIESKPYIPKVPTTPEDYARLNRAAAKRARKAAIALALARGVKFEPCEVTHDSQPEHTPENAPQ